MSEVQEYEMKNFEDIKHIDELGNEYWYARELQLVLKYKEWLPFQQTTLTTQFGLLSLTSQVGSCRH